LERQLPIHQSQSNRGGGEMAKIKNTTPEQTKPTKEGQIRGDTVTPPPVPKNKHKIYVL